MPAPRPRRCHVPPGVTGHWRGRGVGMARAWRGLIGHFWLGWRGHGAGVARACPVTPAILLGAAPAYAPAVHKAAYI
eukprot:gene22882-biopygen4273